MNKSIVRRGIPILLAVALLFYALKDISFGAISEQFRQADYGMITLAGLITIGGYVVRGKRWQLPLQALGFHPTVFRTTIAMQTGVVSSMIVIGSGELTRCLTLQRTDDVPLAQGIGSVVAERIIDLIMLALVLLLTALLEFRRMAQYLSSLTLPVPNTYLFISLIGFIVVASLISWWALSRSTVRNHPVMVRIIGIIQGFSRGFMAIRQLPQPRLFVTLTILNQVFGWLTTYILLLAVDSTQHLPPVAALTIMAVSSLGGLAVPTQGGIGTYHFLVSRALVLYGFTLTGGAVVATFLHAIFFAINLLLSSISFLLLPALITAKSERQPDRLVK